MIPPQKNKNKDTSTPSPPPKKNVANHKIAFDSQNSDSSANFREHCLFISSALKKGNAYPCLLMRGV